MAVVSRFLDRERREESDDRGAGIDDALPGVGVGEGVAGDARAAIMTMPALLRRPLRRPRKSV